MIRMKYPGRNQRFHSSYTLIDFIKDLLKEVFFTILIWIFYKIGRVTINRYRLSLKETIFDILLTFYDYVAERIEWRLLEFFPKSLLGYKNVSELYFVPYPDPITDSRIAYNTLFQSRFILFLKRLEPNLKIIHEIDFVAKDLGWIEKFRTTYIARSFKRLYNGATKERELFRMARACGIFPTPQSYFHEYARHSQT